MPINANVTNQQITASVSETQIDVSVGGGVGPTGATGPTGPQGPSYTLPVATASILGGVKIGSGVSIDGSGVISVATASVAWSDITGKPATFTPASHTHGNITNAGAIGSTSGQIVVTTTSGVLTTASSISAGAVSGLATVATSGSYADLSGVPSPYTLPTATASVLGGVKIGAGVTITDGVISVATNYAAASHGHAIADVTGLQTALDGKASSSHTHTAADTTSGVFDVARLPVGTSSTTVAAGNDARFTDARTPLAHVHSGADITSGTVAAARLGSGTPSASNFLRGDGTWAAAGSTSASDLSSGTLADARLSANARQAIDNLFHPFLLAGM